MAKNIYLLTLISAVAMIYALTPYGAATTPDSLYYIEAARNFSLNKGLTVPDFSLSNNDYLPLTIWPPLYPILLSVLLVFSDTAEVAAKYFNILILCVAVTVFIQIARRTVGDIVAGVAALFLVLQPTIFMIFTYAWSEGLFILLLLTTYLTGLKFMELTRSGEARKGMTWLLIAVLSMGLACNTRYIGIAFLPVLIFIIFLAFNDCLKKAAYYSLSAAAL